MGLRGVLHSWVRLALVDPRVLYTFSLLFTDHGQCFWGSVISIVDDLFVFISCTCLKEPLWGTNQKCCLMCVDLIMWMDGHVVRRRASSAPARLTDFSLTRTRSFLFRAFGKSVKKRSVLMFAFVLSSRSDVKVYVADTRYYKQLPLLYNLSGNSQQEGISKKCLIFHPRFTSTFRINYTLLYTILMYFS